MSLCPVSRKRLSSVSRFRAFLLSLRRELADAMYDNAGIFRTAEKLEMCKAKVSELRERSRARRRRAGQGPRLQHRPDPGDRAGLDAGDGRLPGHRRHRPHREPRRTQPADFPDRDDESWLRHTAHVRTTMGHVAAGLQAKVTFTEYEPAAAPTRSTECTSPLDDRQRYNPDVATSRRLDTFDVRRGRGGLTLLDVLDAGQGQASTAR